MNNSLFDLLSKRQKNDPALLSSKICFFAKEAVERLGKIDSEEIKVVSFVNGCLKIAAENSIVAHRIKMNEEKIKKEIQKKGKIDKPIKIIYSFKERKNH